MEVAAVADALGEDRRGEGDHQAVAPGDRPDRLARQHAAVGRRHRVQRADRQLELPRRVLGMDLIDVHALLGERGQELGGAVAQLDLPGGAVRRTGHRGPELALGGGAVADGPLDLDRRPEGQALPGRVGDQVAQQGARAARMRLALLGDPVHRSPCPAGLRGQHHQPVQIGVEPQIAVGGAKDIGGDDGVVRQEGVEHRGHPDAPGRRRRQLRRRDRLHPGDPRGVHIGQHDPVHTSAGQLPAQGGGPLDVPGTPSGHGIGKGGHALSSSSWAAKLAVGVRVSRPPRRTAAPRRESRRPPATPSRTPGPVRRTPGPRRTRRCPRRRGR